MANDTTDLEALAVQSLEVELTLGESELGRVADLMLRIMQRTARARGAMLSPLQSRTYLERTENEREGLRSAARHCVVALVLLGLIDRT